MKSWDAATHTVKIDTQNNIENNTINHSDMQSK